MTIHVRQATADDIPCVDRLLHRSYPRLLKADYPPSILVTAIPRISRAQPMLVTSGTYFVAENTATGQILGAGGWTPYDPYGRVEGSGHIRHFATDPDAVRQGIGKAVLGHALTDAALRGIKHMACMSTRTAEQFYTAMGFEREHEGETMVQLAGGICFPAISLRRSLA